jgi:hypothetical protein
VVLATFSFLHSHCSDKNLLFIFAKKDKNKKGLFAEGEKKKR